MAVEIPTVNEDVLMISIFLALEGVHAYSAFLPSVFTIKTFVGTPEGHAMIREGEVMASIFLIALASTTVVITKSFLPLILGLLAGGGMILVYEHALARAPVNRPQQSYQNVPVDDGDCECSDS